MTVETYNMERGLENDDSTCQMGTKNISKEEWLQVRPFYKANIQKHFPLRWFHIPMVISLTPGFSRTHAMASPAARSKQICSEYLAGWDISQAILVSGEDGSSFIRNKY